MLPDPKEAGIMGFLQDRVFHPDDNIRPIGKLHP